MGAEHHRQAPSDVPTPWRSSVVLPRTGSGFARRSYIITGTVVGLIPGREDGQRRGRPHVLQLALAAQPACWRPSNSSALIGSDVAVECGDIAQPTPSTGWSRRPPRWV